MCRGFPNHLLNSFTFVMPFNVTVSKEMGSERDNNANNAFDDENAIQACCADSDDRNTSAISCHEVKEEEEDGEEKEGEGESSVGSMWRTNSPSGEDCPAHDPNSDSVTEMDDSLDSAWTDKKHSSYLRSIEASFVEQMYEKKYRFLDTHGQSPKQNELSDPNCAESRPNFLKPINKLKVFRKGCWLKLNYNRAWHLGVSTPRPVPASPWIQHYLTEPCTKGYELPSQSGNLSCDGKKIAEVAVFQINALESEHSFHLKTAHREFPDANEQLHVQHHSIGYKSADSYSICGKTETRHICTQELVVHPRPVSDKGVNMERNHTDMLTKRQKMKIGSISCSDRDQVVPLLQSWNSADSGDIISNLNHKKSTSPNWNGQNMPVSLKVHRK